MFKISRGEREDLNNSVMVGLAAPQIGVLKQVILVDVGVDTKLKSLGELKVFINPKILEASEEIELDREGCYSVDGRLCGIVPRPKWVKIEALDRDGHGFCAKYEGLTARIMQHEIDHLNGIRFPDRVGPKGILHWIEEGELPKYRLEHSTWTRCFSWDDWLAMKKGPSQPLE
jgi:peptide deformylase